MRQHPRGHPKGTQGGRRGTFWTTCGGLFEQSTSPTRGGDWLVTLTAQTSRHNQFNWPVNGRTTCCTLCHCLCLHPANKTIQDTEYGNCFERIRSSFLALGDYNDVDGPSLKVFLTASKLVPPRSRFSRTPRSPGSHRQWP